jgi:fructose-bisphosphate aldolase class II
MRTLRDVLEHGEKSGVAIGHFNVSDIAALDTVFASAHELQLPAIVGVSEGERSFIGVRQTAALVRSLREEHDFPLFLNADHTHSLAHAVEAVSAGFDCVGFDVSSLPIEENIRETKNAVDTLKAINPAVLVEGEIGDIGSGSEIHDVVPNLAKNLTSPEQAKQYVEATGVDILAPAVGNMHGMLAAMVQGTAKKRLQIDRIAHIKSDAHTFLTLHGGSGTDDEDFSRAIAAGINIVHINTELRVAWRNALETALAERPDEVVPYKLLAPVVESVKQVVTSRLRLFNEPRTRRLD